MREIKFRGLAYSPSYKEFQWVYGDLNQMQTETVIHEREAMRTAYFVHEHTVGEYAGLKDKNGTEIYEGDIIWDAHAEIHGKVTFDEGTFCVEWATHIEHLFEVVSDYYAEVVGNIYENSELLGDRQ